jgi:hypothetical protein
MRNIKVFVSYARDNRLEVEALVPYLKNINQQQIDVVWDNDLVPGISWNSKLEQMVKSSDIFIAIASNAFFQSEMCDKELNCFMKRHDPKVVPVFLEDCGHIGPNKLDIYQGLPLSEESGRIFPIARWDDERQAYGAIARGLKQTIDLLEGHTKTLGIEKSIEDAREEERSEEGQGTIKKKLLRYLKAFGISYNDLRILERDGRTFSRYYPRQNIVFEPLSLRSGLNIALLRLELYARRWEDADFYTFLFPYHFAHEHRAAHQDLVDYQLRQMRATARKFHSKCRLHIVDPGLINEV